MGQDFAKHLFQNTLVGGTFEQKIRGFERKTSMGQLKQESRHPQQTFFSLKDTLPYMPDIPAG